MKKCLWLLVFAVFIGSFIRIPEAFAECNEKMCIGKITRLFQSTDKLFILTDGDEGKLNCSLAGGGYIRLSPDNPFFKEMFSMLLAALVSGKQAWVRINDDGQPCFVRYVVIEQ